jgi:lipoyl(octanoyl) transferase
VEGRTHAGAPAATDGSVPMEGLPTTWRILRDPPAGGAWNMAVDEALARCRTEGEGILRIYRWSRPTLSFGRNQKARERYDPEAAAPLGVDVVRRPTGGREVLHDRELTYAVLLPVRMRDGPRESYRKINRALMEGLRSLGADVGLAPGGMPSLPPDAGACFRDPAEGEVTAAGRKLVGSAQRRLDATVLQHGSLLLGPPTVSLESLRLPSAPADEGASGRDGGVSLAELLARPVAFERVASAVEAAMAGTYGGRWARSELRSDEREVAGSLLEQYESSSWTWRR